MIREKNTERVDMRVPPSWLARVTAAADRKGLTVVAYLRMVASERMDADGIPRDATQAAPERKKRA